jgi:hypothetical protein
VIGQLLQVSSGVAAVAAAGLLAYRVWTAPVTKAPPAVYTPVTQVAKAGDVHETESPANGFILVVETKPDQTELWVNDVLSGGTPASVNYDCKPGDVYRITLKHDGFAPLRHEVTCKKDVMLIVTARLEPLRKR